MKFTDRDDHVLNILCALSKSGTQAQPVYLCEFHPDYSGKRLSSISLYDCLYTYQKQTRFCGKRYVEERNRQIMSPSNFRFSVETPLN